MTATPPHRWFRFSLRTAFALLTLACLAASWIAYQLNWIRQRQEARAMVKAISITDARGPGLLWFFGERGHEIISLDSEKLSANEVDRIHQLFPEADLLSTTDVAKGVEELLQRKK